MNSSPTNSTRVPSISRARKTASCGHSEETPTSKRFLVLMTLSPANGAVTSFLSSHVTCFSPKKAFLRRRTHDAPASHFEDICAQRVRRESGIEQGCCDVRDGDTHPYRVSMSKRTRSADAMMLGVVATKQHQRRRCVKYLSGKSCLLIAAAGTKNATSFPDVQSLFSLHCQKKFRDVNLLSGSPRPPLGLSSFL